MLKNIFYRLLGKKALELIVELLAHQISSERTHRRIKKEEALRGERTSTGKRAFRKVESLGPSCSTWCMWARRKEDTESHLTPLLPEKQQGLQEVSGREAETPPNLTALPTPVAKL